MGCDGGTIPRRDELVRLKKKPEQKDKDSERAYRWRHCNLSQQKLQQPIVMCGLGRLYSKLRVIEALLNKDELPAELQHIKSLKDIKDLKLTANPAFSAEDEKNAPFICALIGLEMSGQFRFVALWSCGCVISERALKELNTNICSVCQSPYTEDDVVILNGTDEDVELMRAKMEQRAAKLKALKKDKKNKVKETTATVTASTSSTSTSTHIPTSSKTLKPTSSKSTSTPFTVKPPSVTAAALKREITDVTSSDPNSKKIKKDYSIAKDPKATEVYKSLFTSHEDEQNQDRAHWITYNPFYN